MKNDISNIIKLDKKAEKWIRKRVRNRKKGIKNYSKHRSSDSQDEVLLYIGRENLKMNNPRNKEIAENLKINPSNISMLIRCSNNPNYWGIRIEKQENRQTGGNYLTVDGWHYWLNLTENL